MTLTIKSDTQRHISLKGNYSFAAAGQPLFTHTGRSINYNVLPGQGVVYTIEADGTTLTHDSTTIDSSNIYALHIGVGVDTNGDGVTDAIRHLGIEHLSACHPEVASVSSPRCGGPQVVDFYFDCTQCDETYSLMVKVDDNETRSFSPWNKSFAEFTGSITTDCHSCADCAPTHNCKEVACKLSDSLNNELDLMVGSRKYPDWRGKGRPRPYHATRLHDNSFIYCLSPQTTEGACDSCTHISAVTGAVINGVTYTFTGTTNPSDNTQTLVGQVKHVVDQLNAAFRTEYGEYAHAGSAYYTGSYQDCCPIQLHVNTCYAGFQLLGASSAQIAVSDAYNPFTRVGTVTADPDCIDCGDTATTTTYTCGVRIIAEKIEGDCGCYIDKPLAFYGRKIELNPVGEGFRGKSWLVKEVQAMELPAGFGREIQFLEYQNKPGGKGRIYNRSNVTKGWMNLPGKTDRVENAVLAECDKDYCSYYFKFRMERWKLNNEYGDLSLHSWVHIPNDDTDTLDDWEAIYAKIIATAPTCKPLTGTVCDRALGVCPPLASPAVSPSSTPGVSATASSSVTPSVTPSVTASPPVTPTPTPSTSS